MLFFDILLTIQFIIYFKNVARGAGRPPPRISASADPPPISFIVPVKGEPLDVIAAMLSRFSDIDYPRHMFEVLVVSDDEPAYFAKIRALVDALARELGIDAR
ncbi:MAG: glycosyltransferase family 2 protein, partial [Thermoproteus sp.]